MRSASRRNPCERAAGPREVGLGLPFLQPQGALFIARREERRAGAPGVVLVGGLRNASSHLIISLPIFTALANLCDGLRARVLYQHFEALLVLGCRSGVNLAAVAEQCLSRPKCLPAWYRLCGSRRLGQQQDPRSTQNTEGSTEIVL